MGARREAKEKTRMRKLGGRDRCDIIQVLNSCCWCCVESVCEAPTPAIQTFAPKFRLGTNPGIQNWKADVSALTTATAADKAGVVPLRRRAKAG